jgi:hypothetical protein
MAKTRTDRLSHETVAARIDHMLPVFESLIAETNRLVDQYIEEVAAPRCPGVPPAVVRQLEIDNRIGGALNYPEVLRFLRRARV